jgi:hypothetical protein
MRPLTESEKNAIRDRQDWQIKLEELKSEIYEYAVLAPEREHRVYTKEERVAKLLKDMNYISDLKERNKFLADIPDAVPVKRNRLRDPLEIQEQADLSQQKEFLLDDLKTKYQNVAVLTRIRDAKVFGQALSLLFSDSMDTPLSAQEREAEQQVALEWLTRIATGGFPGLDIRPHLSKLISLLSVPEVGPKAAAILAEVPTAASQKRMAELATSELQPVALRIALTEALARSVQKARSGLDNAMTLKIIRTYAETPPGEFHDSLKRLVALFGPAAQRAADRMIALQPPRKAAPAVSAAPSDAETPTPKKAPAKKAQPKKKQSSDDD